MWVETKLTQNATVDRKLILLLLTEEQNEFGRLWFRYPTEDSFEFWKMLLKQAVLWVTKSFEWTFKIFFEKSREIFRTDFR